MRRARLLMFMVSLLWRAMSASAQEAMPVLETDSQTYSNVVVTSKTATHIFITHSLGMAGIKVRSLDPALQKELGYELEPAAHRRRGSIFTRELIIPAKAREVERKLAQFIPPGHEEAIPKILPVVALVALVFHFFFSYCLMLICKKAGTLPGLAVWLPVIQLVPALRAARMSPWWFLVALLPIVNLLVFVRWSVNICRIRKKSKWLALFLLLPLTSFFALLYLAFSNDQPNEDAGQPTNQFVYQR